MTIKLTPAGEDIMAADLSMRLDEIAVESGAMRPADKRAVIRAGADEATAKAFAAAAVSGMTAAVDEATRTVTLSLPNVTWQPVEISVSFVLKPDGPRKPE